MALRAFLERTRFRFPKYGGDIAWVIGATAAEPEPDYRGNAREHHLACIILGHVAIVHRDAVTARAAFDQLPDKFLCLFVGIIYIVDE